jgi:hypothetical protein
MKSKAAILILFLGVSLHSHAVRPVTLDQLRQAIAGAHGKSDTDVAWQLGDMRLTERLSPENAASLSSALPGEKSEKVLVALAAASQFQEPANQVSSKPAPTVAEQRTIMKLAATYVVETVPRLPNFTATRVTTRYEETPKFESGSGFFVNYEPLHFSETVRSTSVYNQGREDAAAGGKVSMHQGLITWGDFGPILSAVLLDAAQNKLAWSRWDGNGSDALAVFSYSVSVEKSHYEINYCCFANTAATRVANLEPYRKTVGYHGSMFVDPATGTIRRLIVQADLKPTEPIVRADVLIDYAPVDIGGTKYFCPVHSISVARAQSVQLNERYKFAVANQPQPLRDLLNDTSFEEYQPPHGEGPGPTH